MCNIIQNLNQEDFLEESFFFFAINKISAFRIIDFKFSNESSYIEVHKF